jgi:hypothetical protein
MTKLKSPKQKAAVITALAKGETQADIAAKHDVSKMTISKFRKKEDEAVLEMRARLMEDNYEKITDTIRDSVELSHDLTKEFKENGKSITSTKVALKLGIDKTITNPLLARAGVHNSPVINQTNIDNSVNIEQHVDPQVFRMLSKGFGVDIKPMQMNEVIEAEVMVVE